MSGGYSGHVRREADHRTAVTVAAIVTVGLAFVAVHACRLAGIETGVSTLAALLVQSVVTALALAWQARSLRTPALIRRWLNRKDRDRG